MEEDSPLLKAFLMLPLLAGGLFFWNHGEWVDRNAEVLFPVALVVGTFLFSRVFPTLWREIRSAIPLLLIALAICAGALYLVFGGTGDAGAGAGFSGRSREHLIDSMQ